MSELDTMFIKEFKQTMNERRCNPMFHTTIRDIIVPAQGIISYSGKDEVVNILRKPPKTKEYVVRGITEKYFEGLNYANSKRTVSEVDRSKELVKKCYDNKNNVIILPDGTEKTEHVEVTQGSLPIISPVNIKIPFTEEPTKGFSYVDFQSKTLSNGKVARKYIYLVPKEYLYEVNFCALYLTLNSMKRNRTFKSVKVTLLSGAEVYLQVVKYKVGESYNMDFARLLSVRIGTNFDKEIEAILRYWESCGLMFARELTMLEEPYYYGNKGIATRNIAIIQETNSLEYDTYNRNKSVADLEQERKEAYSGSDLFQSYEYND